MKGMVRGIIIDGKIEKIDQSKNGIYTNLSIALHEGKFISPISRKASICTWANPLEKEISAITKSILSVRRLPNLKKIILLMPNLRINGVYQCYQWKTSLYKNGVYQQKLHMLKIPW